MEDTLSTIKTTFNYVLTFIQTNYKHKTTFTQHSHNIHTLSLLEDLGGRSAKKLKKISVSSSGPGVFESEVLTIEMMSVSLDDERSLDWPGGFDSEESDESVEFRNGLLKLKSMDTEGSVTFWNVRFAWTGYPNKKALTLTTKFPPCFQYKNPTKQNNRTINVVNPLRSPISVVVQDGEVEGPVELEKMEKAVMLSKLIFRVKLDTTKLATDGGGVVVVGQS